MVWLNSIAENTIAVLKLFDGHEVGARVRVILREGHLCLVKRMLSGMVDAKVLAVKYGHRGGARAGVLYHRNQFAEFYHLP